MIQDVPVLGLGVIRPITRIQLLNLAIGYRWFMR